MAVFPDRIVLKNSTDSQAAIEAAIGSGGADEIAQGEIVLGLEAGSVQIYAKDASGTIVAVGQGGAIRTALGIGEYVDDTAAGTGGVVSGALYYNTTSSDYRLKS